MVRIEEIMNRKNLIITLIILLLLATPIGFRWIQKNKKPNKIVMISKSIAEDFEFWQIVKSGAELASKEEEVMFEYRGPYQEDDVEQQKKIIKDTIVEKPDIMIIAASNEEELIPLCEEAIKVGIKVFTIDSNIASPVPISFSATDNEAAAKTLAEYVAQDIRGKGEVVIINFVAGVSTAKEREKGMKDVFDNYSNITLYPTKYTNGTNHHAYEVTKDLMYQYPNVTAIIGCNQKTTEGVVRAIEELGLQDVITVAGLDSSLEIIHAIEKDIVKAIVVQRPFNMGYISVKNAIQAYKGEKVPKEIDTGYKLITKNTLDLLENQKLLYPFTK